MTLSLQNGTNSIQFKGLDTHAGHQATACMSMVDLSTRFQTFLLVRFAKLILKNFLLETTICYKRLSPQKNQEKMVIKIRKRASRRIHKTYTIWTESLSYLTKLILLPPRSRMLKWMILLPKISHLSLDRFRSTNLQRSQRSWTHNKKIIQRSTKTQMTHFVKCFWSLSWSQRKGKKSSQELSSHARENTSSSWQMNAPRS